MIRICAWCQKIMGEKEPLEDKSLTHGICEICAEEVKQKRILAKSSRLKENPASSYDRIIDIVITRQVLETPPNKLSDTDIKWLDLNCDAKRSYELKWKISLPKLREVVKMPKDNPVKKWYIGIDASNKTKAFIAEMHPIKKDYPQFTKVVGPFDTYTEAVDYVQGVYKIKENPIVRKTERLSRAHYCPERLVSPTKFDSRSFRTKVIRAHRLTLGCPKGQWDDKKGVCRVPMEVQRILHPEGEAKCQVPGKELRKNPGAGWHLKEKVRAKGLMDIAETTEDKVYYEGMVGAHQLSEVKSRKMGINPAELATKLDDDIEYVSVELYLQGHGVDDVRILLQQEFGIDRIDAEYYAKRAGRIVRGQVISVSTKTSRLLR